MLACLKWLREPNPNLQLFECTTNFHKGSDDAKIGRSVTEALNVSPAIQATASFKISEQLEYNGETLSPPILALLQR